MRRILCVFMLMALTMTVFCNEIDYKMVNVAAPGGLKKADGYSNNIENLKLTGTIDSSDFVTMRDEMSKLTDLDLSEVTVVGGKIPDNAFYDTINSEGKTSLKSIKLPSSITSIGEGAFAHCEGFTGLLTIQGSVTEIGGEAFLFCNNISDIRVEWTTPIQYSTDMLPKDKQVIVPAAAVAAYKAADGWKNHEIIADK